MFRRCSRLQGKRRGGDRRDAVWEILLRSAWIEVDRLDASVRRGDVRHRLTSKP